MKLSHVDFIKVRGDKFGYEELWANMFVRAERGINERLKELRNEEICKSYSCPNRPLAKANISRRAG
jgi:hypothetical protein